MMNFKNLLAAAALAAALPGLAHAEGGVSFLIKGDTLSQPFQFTNISTAGEKITGFGFDLSTIPGARSYIFDTAGPSSTAFRVLGQTGALTGLVGAPTVPDGAQAFQLAFTDFQAAESFGFTIDVDLSNSNSQVIGDHLIGARVFFDFSNGTRAEGFLRAVAGQANASTFVTERIIQSGVPEPGTWALMIAGLGLAGGALRAQRRAALA